MDSIPNFLFVDEPLWVTVLFKKLKQFYNVKNNVYFMNLRVRSGKYSFNFKKAKTENEI